MEPARLPGHMLPARLPGHMLPRVLLVAIHTTHVTRAILLLLRRVTLAVVTAREWMLWL